MFATNAPAEQPEAAPHGTASPSRGPLNTAGRIAAALVLTLGGTVAVSAPAHAEEIGPDPSEDSIEATTGPFDTDDEDVSSLVSGFGGGTIYYPTDDSYTYGGVVVAPGYTASSSSMSWLGPRLASQGFVVFTIDTNSRYDQPSSRGRQIGAALDYLADSSDVSDIVDGDRMAAMGHSMGGGGTLEIAEDRPELKAAIPLTAWNLDKTWGSVSVPTLVVGAENDSVASVNSHSIPFYESLPSSPGKAYLELEGASHFAPNLSNTTIAKYSISWLKLYVDGDQRYEQFLCPPPDSGGLFSDISDYRETNC
ncbi:alpha/beta hydrolase family protein [Streptomonospora wellingtoniae]|uniref:Poly(ethylene terephthalate) hydrolase n=1 Tax=Streptomonospora wellingtoniae TaxID=3075544 RepID=A0ABU2KYZ7_9ACTN|nr:alpha/beta hydrolase [Streptomonospora sp. DSM 45055]MDT0304288.1 alpha/beta hydrolase [Streptomonospora sp. DSM 45055]